MTLECPKCKSPVAREGQRFCYRCGHELRDYYDSLNIEIKELRSDSHPLPVDTSDDATNGDKGSPYAQTAEFSSMKDPAAPVTPPAASSGTSSSGTSSSGTPSP